MKKTLSLLLALVLVFAMSVPALAAEPNSGSTTVTYVVAPSYSITIPTTVTIPSESTQTVGVNAGAIIPADKSLEFKITAATNYAAVAEIAEAGFKLKNGVGTNVFLKYKITYGTDIEVALNTAFLTVDAATAYTGSSVTLTYALNDTIKQAGTYTDMLTFAVGYAT